MKFDFTGIGQRRGHDAWAYDGVGKHRWGGEPTLPKPGFDFIAMWVADMNFATCPAVTRAIAERVRHPAFGYFAPSDSYYDAILSWHKHTHRGLLRDFIGYENGVHGLITSSMNVLTKPGDGVLVHSPMYSGFHADIDRIGRRCVFSPLARDDTGVWRMDYDDMEKKIRENNIRVAILCSPHNPTGRVWEAQELKRAMEVFEASDVTVISDEIWSDIVFPGQHHIPTQAVSEWARNNTIAAYAPSKTFNLAGLVGSYHIIYDDDLRECVSNFARKTHYNEMNVLSMHALIGAYSDEGRAWVGELVCVLENNARFACDFISKHLEGVDAATVQGTYMLFMDCSGYLKETGRTLSDVIRTGWDVGVGWQDGREFHGPTHIRVNLASPLSRIEEAFSRMERYVFV